MSSPTLPLVRPNIPAPLAGALWLLFIAISWGFAAAVGVHAAYAEVGALPIPVPVISLIAVLTRAFSLILETGFYWMWWATAGARPRFGALLLWIASASLFEVTAEIARLTALGTPAVAPWMAPLAGFQIVKDWSEGCPPALLLAAGGTGLLAVARILLTAHGQARELGRRIWGPLALTACCYVATRSAVALFFEWIRGRSPLG